MTTAEEGWVVKFVPFASAVDSPFWVKYCQEKLETIQLNEEPFEIRASYTAEAPARLQCQESSLHTSSTVPNERVSVSGQLIGFNTLEMFQKVDKNALLHDFFSPRFADGNRDCLSSVVLLTYADLKNHKVLYWFGFPALMTKSQKSIRALKQERLGDLSYPNLSTQIDFLRRSLTSDGYKGLPPYFIFSSNSCLPLSVESYASISSEASKDDVVFGFFDPNGAGPIQPEQAMGWPMRNLVAYLSFHMGLGGQIVRILSYRPKQVRRLSPEHEASTLLSLDDDADSVLLNVKVPFKEDYEWDSSESSGKYKVVGWELNARSKPGPRWVNLRPLLDPHHLAVQAADLNLKLMKWRAIPNLQVELLQSTKVLIIGAGTLGCSVARVLLGWGIRKIKILDYGKVSYSNPVRQSLFTLEDCRDESGGGRPKSVAAAEALRSIAADVDSEGIVLSIPMPGHAENLESVRESVELLDHLIQDCDVVYLLTDTRESRWLPTVMAAAHDKMLINAALGLDSWLVMRHGAGFSSTTSSQRLGCYFCNDIVAPENSTRNRTLDQQCTVTRPGLAPIASSLAVELMVSLLHHRDGVLAEASSSGGANFSPTISRGTSASELGVVPHQIRGSLVTYTVMTPSVSAFQHCTGCSRGIVDAYLNDKVSFVLCTCESSDGSYLEGVSGLNAFRAEAAEKLMEVEDWDEEEDHS